MKNQKNFIMRPISHKFCSFPLYIGVLILLSVSCTNEPEPYSIIEISGNGNVSNYSKSFLLMQNKPDSVNPTPMIVSKGDILSYDESILIYNDSSRRNRFQITNNDSSLYINGKLYSFSIPDNDKMIPWIQNLADTALSSLQFISFDSKMPDSYLPVLTKLAEKRPDAGLYFEGNFAEMAKVLKIFKPRYIISPSLIRNDFSMLARVDGVEILMVSLEDSVITDPLPALPSLKQIILSNTGKEIRFSDNLLADNRQIERVIIQKNGSLDFALLNPLVNLKELVISGIDTVVNFDLVNRHKKIEVLSVTGDDLLYDPAVIKLPDLRWVAFSPNLTQEEFGSFIGAHPDLEVIEIISNNKISNLQPLSTLSRLYGLTLTDTVTDITSIKALTNLKYLSVPAKFLSDKFMKAELQNSLPDTRIAANEGFCLGSGWLLLLIPLVLILRFIIKGKTTIS